MFVTQVAAAEVNGRFITGLDLEWQWIFTCLS